MTRVNNPCRAGWSLAACAIVIGLGACGTTDEVARSGLGGDTDQKADNAVEDTLSVDDLRALEGYYALRNAVATTEKVPMLGTQHSLGIYYGYLQVELQEGVLTGLERFCRTDFRTTSAAKVSMTDEAVQALPTKPFELQVSREDGQLKLYRPFTPLPIGAELEDPLDELPTQADDPRLIDLDGDGQPGFTSHITLKMMGMDLSGDVYCVRRENYDCNWLQDERGDFVGTTVDLGEQNIVGGTNRMLAVDIDSVQDPDPSRSSVVLVRVSGLDEPMACDAINEQLDDLFVNHPLTYSP